MARDTTIQAVGRAAATPAGTQAHGRIERRISDVGQELGRSLDALLEALPAGRGGPVDLARALGLDKVLASRVLKAVRKRDPLAVVHLAPGPDPLRRLVRAASRQGVDAPLVPAALAAIDAFEQLIRQEAGDRSSLDAMISAWLPEARKEFELRRKQAAFKAMSQLKGAMAEINLATVLLHPSDDGAHLDVVWIFGLLGLRRLRPGAGIKFASRRITGGDGPRRPVSLDGVPVDGLDGVRLDGFCSSPPPQLEVSRAGEVVHYVLAGHAFGPRSAVDLVFAEANFAEMPRSPGDAGRRGYVFAEVGTPSKTLHFDVLVHEDVYRGLEPSLFIYDTAFDGVADVNDRGRDIDRLDLFESIEALGAGTRRLRTSEVPRYAELVAHACGRLGWDAERFAACRCRIDYPLYGSQVAVAFGSAA